jgi:hypothetical protein
MVVVSAPCGEVCPLFFLPQRQRIKDPKSCAVSLSSPAYAGSHGCQAVEECAAGVLRSLGEGGHASAGSAEDTKGTTAVKPWGSTIFDNVWSNVEPRRYYSSVSSLRCTPIFGMP